MSVSTQRAGANPTTSCLSQTVGFDILQASTNGAAQTYTLEQKIPARAIVLQRWISLNTEFSGGGMTSCVVDLGWSNTLDTDANGWYSAEDVFTGAGEGIKAVPSSPGVRLAAGACDVSDYERSVTVTFTPDGAHKLSEVTAGSLSVNVVYLLSPALDQVLPVV